MNRHEKSIKIVRDRYMSTRKILCTGNPENKNCIAYGIKQIFPNATFIHRSKGFDLPTQNFKEFVQEVKKHNTFINASYIGPMVQNKLLQVASDEMKLGQIFNIGSTHEYDGFGNSEYTESKIHLRDLSLQINNFRIQTTHIVLGGLDLNTHNTVGWIKPIKIAELIQWIIKQDSHCIPLIGIDQHKQPW